MGGVSGSNERFRIVDSALLVEVGVGAGKLKRTWLCDVGYGDGTGVVGHASEAIASVYERVRAGTSIELTGGRSDDVGSSSPETRELVG